MLLVGQISIENETIGERFSKKVNAAWNWGGKELIQPHLVKAMPLLSKWVPTRSTPIPKTTKKESEKISASDRESILHLLE